MTCKCKKRIACVVHRNESNKEIIGKDENGEDIFKRHIKFVEDRCTHENDCTITSCESRGLKLLQ